MKDTSYNTISINNDMFKVIEKIILETRLYRNPSEFVIGAVREKIDEIHQRQIDQRKLEAFFIRENQIKAEHLKKS